MFMMKFYLGLLLSFFISGLFAQIPAGYYNGTSSLTGNALKSKLHTIIRGHTVRSYNQLWTDFQTTDKKANGKVWDMYSDVPGGSPAYEYTFGSGQCGTYSAEGDCYNREHSFPKSWWGGGSDTMYTDLFHLVPTDGFVNSKRSNFPYGEVGSATWTSTNGCKLGTSNYPGYSGTVFEPIDEYKGDFARNYFYMATRYKNKISSWNSDMLAGADFSSWALNLLLDWNTQDPVSQKELDRNDHVYGIQGNRNPFIDHPEWVNDIWNPSPNNAPVFAAGYPKSDNISNTTFDLLVKQNKIGTAYYVVLDDGAASPSSTQVKNGEDANGISLASNRKGNISIAVANTQYSITVSGLSLGTDYDVYVVSEDNASPVNLQSTATLLDVLTTGGSGGSSQTYTENFDDNSAWSSGSGYATYTYTSSSASHNDLFTISNGLKETNDNNSAPNACRLKNTASASLRYECEGTIASFSIWAARWDNSPKPNVTVQYSVDGGSTYTTAFTFDGDDFSGNKVFKQFSHTFTSPITNNSGSKIYIEFLTTSGERMLYDDFEVTFSTGTGSTNSNESDIVKKSSWTEPQNIDYKSYITASSLTTSNAIEVAKFTIRDGGSDNTDADAVATKLSDIDFVIDNYDNLDAIALFDGSTKLAEITNVTSTVSFSNLNIEALDESTKDFSVYVSFKSSVTDNQNLKISISSVTFDNSGSAFASSDGGGASTDNTADYNKIAVTADRLAFTNNKPPASVDVGSDFNVELIAIDVNNNRDLDVNTSVSLAKASGIGILSSATGLTQTLSSGVYSWTDVQYDTEEDFTISASASGLTSTTSSTITASNQTYFSDLMFTEYVEGSSNNKYLEIWNNTGLTVNLSNYSIQIYYNGNSTAGSTISLTGTLAQDGIFVIANPSATVWSGTPNMTSNDINFNGNDAVVLVNSNAKGNVDVIGVIGNNSNFALDKTLERNATASGPNATYTSSEWDSKPQDDVSGLGVPGPLPIELLSFNAVFRNEAVYLNWQTATETNNDFFSIERSIDAQSFESIGTIKGAGNSNTIRNYTYSDNLISRINTLYYRLKQTDYNGQFSYSKTLSVSHVISEYQLLNSFVLGNVLQLEIQSPIEEVLQVELYDLSGKLIQSVKLKISKGSNDYQVQLNSISSGIYMLRIYSSTSLMIDKLFIN